MENTLKSDIISFVEFERDTSVFYPWAMPAEEITENHLDTICQKVEELSVDGTWDSDLIRDAVEAVCGTNPELK